MSLFSPRTQPLLFAWVIIERLLWSDFRFERLLPLPLIPSWALAAFRFEWLIVARTGPIKWRFGNDNRRDRAVKLISRELWEQEFRPYFHTFFRLNIHHRKKQGSGWGKGVSFCAEHRLQSNSSIIHGKQRKEPQIHMCCCYCSAHHCLVVARGAIIIVLNKL